MFVFFDPSGWPIDLNVIDCFRRAQTEVDAFFIGDHVAVSPHQLLRLLFVADSDCNSSTNCITMALRSDATETDEGVGVGRVFKQMRWRFQIGCNEIEPSVSVEVRRSEPSPEHLGRKEWMLRVLPFHEFSIPLM